MHKIKYGVLFLVAIVIVVFGAMLPIIAFRIYDSNIIGKINYEEMKAIRLEIRQLTMIDKLNLMVNGASLLVDENKAANTKTDIDKVVQEKLRGYKDNGLINEDLSSCRYEYTPYMYYMSGDIHNIFWQVTVMEEDKQWELLHLLVDDETGLIFQISYTSYQINILEESEKLWDLFCTLYFEGWEMGIEIVAMDMKKEGMEVISQGVICVDEQGNQAFLCLYINEKGFFSSIESVEENVNESVDDDESLEVKEQYGLY